MEEATYKGPQTYIHITKDNFSDFIASVERI